jgi:hypothetical protein
MIDTVACVVFSRDRALQLDAFLRSAATYAAFDRTAVIFRATDPDFARAYETAALQHPAIEWIPEGSFRNDVQRAVRDDPWVVFNTDDDVYFETIEPFDLRVDEVCFTLRLGLNTTYCYPLDSDDVLLDPAIEETRVSWDWRGQGTGAYSYPLAVNGHVFRGDELASWLAASQFGNPNELEAALQALLPEIRPRMASFPASKVVSIPANLVNETFPNRHGGLYDVRELNDRFLGGERLDVTQMNFSDVNACHQEIPFVFTDESP